MSKTDHAQPSSAKIRAQKLSTLGDLKPNERNPRTITPERLEMLKASLEEHGDLSGFVINVKTGNMVGGHQRKKVLPADAKIVIDHEHKKPTRTGTVRQGHVLIDGEQFAYREVSWSVKKETQALLAANQHGGEFSTTQLSEILKGMDESNRLLAGFDSQDVTRLLDEQTVTPSSSPKQTDDDYSLFELVMLHANKLALINLLDEIKLTNGLVTTEEALMRLVASYKKKK